MTLISRLDKISTQDCLLVYVCSCSSDCCLNCIRNVNLKNVCQVVCPAAISQEKNEFTLIIFYSKSICLENEAGN